MNNQTKRSLQRKKKNLEKIGWEFNVPVSRADREFVFAVTKFAGEGYSARDISCIVGMSRTVIHSISRKYDIAIRRPPRKGSNRLEIDGVWDTTTGHCRRYGLKRNTVMARIAKDFTNRSYAEKLKAALTAPIHARRGRKPKGREFFSLYEYNRRDFLISLAKKKGILRKVSEKVYRQKRRREKAC